MNVEAVGGFEDNLLRHDKLFRREIGGPSRRGDGLRCSLRISDAPYKRPRVMQRVRGKVHKGIAARDRDRAPLNSLPTGQIARSFARGADTPDVAAVNVIAVRIKEHGFLIGA